MIWERSSARNTISGARVPVLVLHSADDWLVPVDQAEILREAAAGNELVRVWTVAAGGHGAIDAIDERWAYAVYRALLRALGGVSRPRTWRGGLLPGSGREGRSQWITT